MKDGDGALCKCNHRKESCMTSLSAAVPSGVL
jgi:hypothetical protein